MPARRRGSNAFTSRRRDPLSGSRADAPGAAGAARPRPSPPSSPSERSGVIGDRRASEPSPRRSAGPRRPDPSSDPLAGVELVLIDGNNLVGVLTRTIPGRPPRASDGMWGDVAGHARGGVPGATRDALPVSAVIGRIRGAIPAGVRVELIFDGPPRGGVIGRLATAFSVRYSGRISADAVIADVVARQAAEHGPAATWSILVVTDDRDLREQVRLRGARSAGARWLAGRIGGMAGLDTRGSPGAPGSRAAARSGTTIGHGRPPRRPDGG